MAKKTQGTELWIVTSSSAVTKITNLTEVGNPSGRRAQIGTTVFDSLVEESMDGLPDGVEVSYSFNWDPGDESHALLETLRVSGDEKVFILGESGSTDAPTVSAGVVSYPAGRQFFWWRAKVLELNITAQVNNKYEATLIIKRKTERTPVPAFS